MYCYNYLKIITLKISIFTIKTQKNIKQISSFFQNKIIRIYKYHPPFQIQFTNGIFLEIHHMVKGILSQIQHPFPIMQAFQLYKGNTCHIICNI